MPSRITHFYHESANTNAQASVGTAFDKTKAHSHDLFADFGAFGKPANWRGRFEGVVVQVSSIVTATQLTFRVCLDADGDNPVVPDTTATISTGITTATEGAVAFKIDVPVFHNSGGVFYLFFKTDAGTVTVDSSSFTWSE